MADHFRRILGIRFFVGEVGEALRHTARGGLVVVPSAPVLVGLPEDPAHRAALEGADFALTDSGFMVLLWHLRHGERLPRLSGLRFLRVLLAEPAFRPAGSTFWIMPSAADAAANLAWLERQGIAVPQHCAYQAPVYAARGPLEDADLLARLEACRPRYIVINLGGGVQERLGWYLRKNLSAFRNPPVDPTTGARGGPASQADPQPAIVCTGAAIAFLSGRQASIPGWADALRLGWLLRSLSDPARFLPRYWKSLRLAPLLWQYGERSCRAPREQ